MMSDARRLEAVVLGSLMWHLPQMQADNRLSLTYLIVGLILGRNVQLSKIAERVNYPYKESSLEDRFRRLVANDHLAVQVSFSIFVGLILQAIDPQRVVLSIDTTKSGGACVTLMVGVSYRSRSLPIGWVTFKGKKGHTAQSVQLALLQTVAGLLPVDSQVILLGDGEFDGSQLIAWLVNQAHWHYVCRTAQDTQVLYQGQWLALHDLPLTAEQETLFNVDAFTAAHHLPGCRVMAVWVAKEQRHWFFVTNFQSLAEAKRWYLKRFQIETLFSDLKGRGFNLAQSHLKDPERVNRLLLAVAIAYLFIVFWGVEAIRSGTFRTLVRTDRFDHSLTQLGFKYIYHQLKKLLPVPPLLRWPEPDSFCHIVLV
jgi:hypothetical protein